MPRGRGLEATYERGKGAMRAGVAGANVRERGWWERTSESEGGGRERQRARVMGANARERGRWEGTSESGGLTISVF